MPQVTYKAVKAADVPADLMRDLNTGSKEWAVIRTSSRGPKVWGFHTSEQTAKAAVRRGERREVVTR